MKSGRVGVVDQDHISSWVPTPPKVLFDVGFIKKL